MNDRQMDVLNRQAWDMVGHVINTWKDDLLKARLRGMWFAGAKPSGGKLLLGKMKVYGARDRRVLQADGEIQLNLDWWTHELTTDAQRLALVHHELCHMGRKIVRGQPDEDLPGVERGRPAILTPAMMAEIKAGLEKLGDVEDVSVSFRTH